MPISDSVTPEIDTQISELGPVPSGRVTTVEPVHTPIRRSSMPPPLPAGFEAPDTDALESQVALYDNSDETTRDTIAAKLRQDARSSNPVLRYCVLEAMIKISVPRFSDVLLSAMEDSNASVRNLALHALTQP